MTAIERYLKSWSFPLTVIVSSLILLITSQHSFLLFHSLAEMFTVVIAFGIFAIAWSSRRYINNNFLLIIGIGYFFIGGFDLIHTLSYKGMEVFPGYTADLPTQFWIITRYLEALTFLVAFLFLKNNTTQGLRVPTGKSDLIFIIYSGVSLLLLLSVFYWKIFPAAYVEGEGLTSFKKISEYIISSIFLVSLTLLFKKRKMLDPEIANLFSMSLIIKVASELSFTEYAGVYDFSNIIGHLFEFISFLLLYKAVIGIGLLDPYRFLFRDIKKNEIKYRSLFDNMIDGFAFHSMIFDKQGKPVDYVFLEVNNAFEKLTGLKKESLIGRKVTEAMPGIEKDPADWIGRYGQVVLTGNPLKFESFSQNIDRWYSVLAYRPEKGHFAVVFEDITERKRAEEALHEAEKDLSHAQKVSHTGSWRLNVQKNELTWSQEAHQIFGVPRDTPLTYETFLSIVHPEDRDFVDRQWKRALEGKPYDIEHRIVVGNEVKWVRERAELEFDDKGVLLGGFGTTQDITGRKKNEEKIRSLARFPEENPNPVMRISIDGQLKYANKPALRFLAAWGWDKKAPVPDIFIKAAKTIFQDNQHKQLEVITPEDRIYHMTLSPNGTDSTVNLYGADVTDTRKAEKKLLETQKELHRKSEELLEESYKYLGTINRKISLLLDVNRQVEEKKKKKEILDFILDSAMKLSKAKTGLVYESIGNREFRLLDERNLSEEQADHFQTISIENIIFARQLLDEKKRLNGPCRCEPGKPCCFNISLGFSYFIVLPLLDHKKLLGFIFLGFTDRISMDHHDLEFLDAFAIHASLAIAKAKIMR